MPYGKYQGRLLCDIPLHYLVWMNQKDAFPNGKIGFLLKNLLEIKTNELEPILWKQKELYKQKSLFKKVIYLAIKYKTILRSPFSLIVDMK